MSRTNEDDWALAFQPEDWMNRVNEREFARVERGWKEQARYAEVCWLEAMWKRSA